MLRFTLRRSIADDDPKTAEVISKVLLLARDAEIKDPNLLSQITAAAAS